MTFDALIVPRNLLGFVLSFDLSFPLACDFLTLFFEFPGTR